VADADWRTWVALLRGVNVGGRARLAMSDLRAVVESLGGRDVATYVQSGNVVFRSRHADEAAVQKALEDGLAADLALPVAVVVRSAPELARIAGANPYAAHESDPTKLHVVFFAREPGPRAAKALEARAQPPEAATVSGREAYLHLPGGIGRSKLGAAVGTVLETPATARNWRTVTALAERAGAAGADG
jgi:uncharacterized protein (DUF1697 family)